MDCGKRLLSCLGLIAIAGAGCNDVRNTPTSMVVWQEGEAVASARQDVSKIADTDKKPASGGAVLYGQVLSPQDAAASWKVFVPWSMEQAKIVFRYGRVHWRAEMKPAAFTLELTGPGPTIRREIAFGPTRGWGTKSKDYDLLSEDLGPVTRGEWTIQLTSNSATNDLSIDGFFIAPQGVRFDSSEFNDASRLLIDSQNYVGISAPPILHQSGSPVLKVLSRSFDGTSIEVRAQIRRIDQTKAWPLSGVSTSTTQPTKVTSLQLPPGLPDGEYEVVFADSSRPATLAMPVTLAGELLDTLDARIEQLQTLGEMVKASNDPNLRGTQPMLDHLIQFIKSNQQGLADMSGQPVDAAGVRRQGLAEEEGTTPTTPSLARLRLALDQSEKIVARIAARQPPVAGRTGEFRLAYRSAVDNRLAVYRVFIPSSYDRAKQLPMILFLHGGGGDENYWPELANGQILKMLEERGYIGVMPHWNRRNFGEHWMQDHLQLLDEVSALWPKVDADRIYLTGISMGGGGTFRLAVAHPERFAAICCVSGPGDPEQAANLKRIPMMIIHGGSDNVSPAERAVKMNEMLQSLGHPVSFHLFPLHGHNYHAELYLGLTLDFFDKHRRAAAATSVRP